MIKNILILMTSKYVIKWNCKARESEFISVHNIIPIHIFNIAAFYIVEYLFIFPVTVLLCK